MLRSLLLKNELRTSKANFNGSLIIFNSLKMILHFHSL